MCCSSRRNRFKLSAQALTQRLTQFYQSFEDASVRLTAILGEDGSVKACVHRSDTTPEDTDKTLTKISDLKRQATILATMVGGARISPSPVHVIGKTEAVSLYDLGEKDLLALVMDTNPNVNNWDVVRAVEPRVQEQVRVLYAAMHPKGK